MALLVHSTKHFKELRLLLKLFQKIKRRGRLPNVVHKANTTLIPKTDNDITSNLQTDVLYENRCTNP